MSIEETIHQPWVQRLAHHLQTEAYSASATKKRLAAAGGFLLYLRKHAVGVEAATVAHEQGFLKQKLRLYRKRHGRLPRDSSGWRWGYTGGIHMLLYLAQGKWPPVPKPSSPQEQVRWELCDAYAQWLSKTRGLAPETIQNRRTEALRFLDSLGDEVRLSHLTVANLDNYVKSRAPQLQRVSRQHLVTCLRGFLRYLHAQGRITQDLSCAVVNPSRYTFESIPSALRAEHVEAVLKASRSDRTVKGVRDYAILMLLSTYGLRAGEVAGLRLDDVDWRRDRLHIRHSKTGCESFLPLLSPVGEAILKYLQQARPATKAREIFIRVRSPFRPLRSGSSLSHLIEHRLQRAGIRLDRKRGAHAFRHARAVSLLHAAIPLKSIGDILGHRSTDSTHVYLKLATSELRAVGLEIPVEVSR